MDIIESIKDVLLRLGAGWVIWVLFGLGGVSLAVYAERLAATRARGLSARAVASLLDAHLARRAIDDALDVLTPLASVPADIARAGLRLAHLGVDTAEKAMESATAAARKELESRLVILATIGNNAPFVGLLGTVIGVVLAFEALGSGAAGAAQGAAPTAVMAAIAEALVATAVGIAVALPTVAAHNHVQRRITALLDDAETIARLVHAYLVARPATGEEA